MPCARAGFKLIPGTVFAGRGGLFVLLPSGRAKGIRSGGRSSSTTPDFSSHPGLRVSGQLFTLVPAPPALRINNPPKQGPLIVITVPGQRGPLILVNVPGRKGPLIVRDPTPPKLPTIVKDPIPSKRPTTMYGKPGRPGLDKPVSLPEQERRGGHTGERHVGQTDRELKERMRKQPHITGASSFTDEKTGEIAIAKVIRQNEQGVRDWARTAEAGRRLLLRGDPGIGIVGRGLNQGDATVTDRSGVTIVLRSDGHGGYIVLTSFPR